MTIEPDIIKEMTTLVRAGDLADLRLRALGGLGVFFQCQGGIPPALQRTWKDIDLAARKEDSRHLPQFFSDRGYQADQSFNLLNGDRRQLYHDPINNRQVDIFIHEFAMCHKFPLSDRLPVDGLAALPAELFLSKAQIVQLNEKDLVDLAALLLNCPAGTDDLGKINLDVVCELTRKDWGFFHTIQRSLQALRSFIKSLDIPAELHDLLEKRVVVIESALENAPKTAKWKARASLGERVRWYDEVEEVELGDSTN